MVYKNDVKTNSVSITAIDLCLAFSLMFLSFIANWLVADGRRGLSADSCLLLNMAQNVGEGKGISVNTVSDEFEKQKDKKRLPRPTITKPPMFQLLAGILIKSGVSSKTSGWILAASGYIIAVGLFYILCRTALAKTVAYAISFLYAFNLEALKWSVYAREETIYLCFTLAALVTVTFLKLKKINISGWAWILAGIFAGSALLTRYLGVALVFAIGIVIIIDYIRGEKQLRNAIWYLFGLMVVGIWPFYGFIKLWKNGIRPAFYYGAETTWFQILAGMISSLQNHFIGFTLIWLYNGDAFDILIIGFSAISICFIIAATYKNSETLVTGLYIFLYIIILYIQVASAGIPNYEARYSFPIEFLFVFCATVIIFKYMKNVRTKNQSLAVFCAGVLLLAYLTGQWNRYIEFRSFPKGMTSNREYCYSPKLTAWLDKHASKDTVIMATQGFYQILAETNNFLWCPIPPANKYPTDEGYHDLRWDLKKVQEIAKKLDIKYMVLLNCSKGHDPILEDVGYGVFISELFDGKMPEKWSLIEKNEEGIIYDISSV